MSSLALIGVCERLDAALDLQRCANYSCMLEISRLSAAKQLGQPMHSQSANFGKFKLNSRNLSGVILHDSVDVRERRGFVPMVLRQGERGTGNVVSCTLRLIPNDRHPVAP